MWACAFMPRPAAMAARSIMREKVADESEGKADQDRREGGEPRPLCYLPDGRGRHRTANVPGDFAAHRGATAAATTRVRRSVSCIQEQPTEGVRPKCQGKWSDQTLDQAFGLPEVLVAVSTSRLSCKRAGKTRTLMPVWDSSGESRLNGFEAAESRGRLLAGQRVTWLSTVASAYAGHRIY